MRTTSPVGIATLFALAVAWAPLGAPPFAGPPDGHPAAAVHTSRDHQSQAKPRAGQPPAQKPQAQPRAPKPPERPSARPPSRRPPAGDAAQPRGGRAVPRPPAVRPPAIRPYRVPYRYSYGFDFMFGPYGTYWYWGHYPYPSYPYPMFAPGCDDWALEAPGQLRLEVMPPTAAVFVDGFYAGVVDDFDGFLQTLAIEPGPHHVEVRLEGSQTAVFDVNIQAGQTITYRATLRPVP